MDNIQLQYISTADEAERAILVARADFPEKLFEAVACDESSKVKIALLENHDLGAELIAKFCEDEDLSVRTAAYDKLCEKGKAGG